MKFPQYKASTPTSHNRIHTRCPMSLNYALGISVYIYHLGLTVHCRSKKRNADQCKCTLKYYSAWGSRTSTLDIVKLSPLKILHLRSVIQRQSPYYSLTVLRDNRPHFPASGRGRVSGIEPHLQEKYYDNKTNRFRSLSTDHHTLKLKARSLAR